MKKNILGVKIDDVSMEEAIKRVGNWLSGETRAGFYIVTPNPEFLVTAQEDPEFKKILNNADLSIPDGRSLKLAGIKNTIPGIDFMEGLVKLAAEKGFASAEGKGKTRNKKRTFTVGFLGGRPGVAERVAECLLGKYPDLKVSFASGDIEVDEDGREIELSSKNQESSKKKLNSKFLIPNSDLLFVAFGYPKQEKWIYENLPKLPVKVAMGVGGAFDYISGKVPRAPKWIRDLGFEWLFRLILQPWRIKRQISLLKYLWLVLHSN